MLYVLLVICTIVAIVCIDHYTTNTILTQGEQRLTQSSRYFILEIDGKFVIQIDGSYYLEERGSEYRRTSWLSDATRYKSIKQVYYAIGSIK